MHDAIQFERLGVPATVIITEPFEALATAFAQTLGMPGYPAVVLAHPVSSKDDETLSAIGRAVAAEVVERLTGQRPST